jgi:hypothetical protein
MEGGKMEREKDWYEIKLRYFNGKLQERVLVNGYYEDGEEKEPQYEWVDVEESTKEWDDGYRER